MLEEDLISNKNEVIKITSKGARNIGLMLIKNALKELDLCKQKFISIRNLVNKLADDEADRILLFTAQKALSPVLVPFYDALLSLNDDFLEVLRESLIQKKIKTLNDVMELYDFETSEGFLENEMDIE